MWSRKKHVVKLTNFVSTCGQKCAGSGRWSKISAQTKCVLKESATKDVLKKKPAVKENLWSKNVWSKNVCS